MAATLLLILVVVLVAGGLVFGIITLLSGDDPGLSQVDADDRARPLPNNRSLTENDLKTVRFDLALRGYRMAQVDRVLRRTAYDVGYKDEMIAVLEAEVTALRDGRREDADLLRKARESAASPGPTTPPAGTVIPAATRTETVSPERDLTVEPAEADEVDEVDEADEPDEASAADETEAGPQAYEAARDTGPGRLAPRPLLDGVNLSDSPAAPESDTEAEATRERHD
jgi:DivIVA domain-containing protein